MLPEGLSSSYKRYKEDTNIFSTWLGQTAVKCGYKPDPSARRIFSNASATSDTSASSSSSVFSATSAASTSTSFSASSVSNISNHCKPEVSSTISASKGKARKNAKAPQISTSKPFNHMFETTIVIVSTRDLVEQANIIVGKKKHPVVFPSVIKRVAERAIQARKRFVRWFQKAQPEDEEVNASHEHFIGVLETILEILTPCYEKSKTENGPGITKHTKAKENLNIPMNIFEMLDVEDITDENLVASGLKSHHAKAIPKRAPLETYELDSDLDIDVPFIVFCFFEDLHRVQEFVNDTWKSHKSGSMDIGAAYLLTNYAVTIVQQEEARIIMSLPSRYVNGESSMLKIVDKINAPTMEHFKDPTKESNTTDLDEFLYFPVYHIINKTLRALQDCEPEDFPPVVPPISISLFSKEIDSQAKIDALQEDDVKLTHFLLELAIQERFQAYGGFTIPSLGHSDSITRYLRALVKTKTPEKAKSTWMVFGASLLLDIWRILGDGVNDSHDKLLKMSAMAKAVMRYTSPGTMEYDATKQDFLEVWQDIHDNIQYNPIPCMKKSWLSTISDKETSDTAEALAWNIYSMQQRKVKKRTSRMDEDLQASQKLPEEHQSSPAEIEIMKAIASKNLSTRWIRHSTDPIYFLRQNPLCTGLQTLRLKLALERVGLAFVLSNGTSFSIAHIYNAGQQAGYIKEKWHSLDKLIDANLHDIFTGGRPTIATEFHSRALLGMGYSATNLVKDRRRPGQIQWRDVYQKWKQPDISKLLEEAHEPDGDMHLGCDNIARSMFRVRELALATKQLTESQAKKLSIHHRTPIQILAELRDFLPKIMENMDIEYITVTRKCDVLMAQLHLVMALQGLVVPVMPHKGSENFQLMINIMGHNMQGLRPNILKFAAEEVAQYIDDGNAEWTEDVEPFAVPSSVAGVHRSSLEETYCQFHMLQRSYASVRAGGKLSVLAERPVMMAPKGMTIRPLWKGVDRPGRPESVSKEQATALKEKTRMALEGGTDMNHVGSDGAFIVKKKKKSKRSKKKAKDVDSPTLHGGLAVLGEKTGNPLEEATSIKALIFGGNSVMLE